MLTTGTPHTERRRRSLERHGERKTNAETYLTGEVQQQRAYKYIDNFRLLKINKLSASSLCWPHSVELVSRCEAATCQCTSRRGAVSSPVRHPGAPGPKPWRRFSSRWTCLTGRLRKRSSVVWDPEISSCTSKGRKYSR